MGIWEWAARSRRLRANRRLARLLGEAPPALSDPWDFLFTRSELSEPEKAAIHREWDSARGAWEREIPVRTPEGHARWIACNANLVRDAHGRLIRAAGVIRDVTERKQLESGLMQAQKMECIGRLAAGVAHDINNVVTAIFGYAEIAKSTLPPDHPAIRALGGVEKAAEQAMSVNRGLLAFGRGADAPASLVDLRAVVMASCRLLRHILPASVKVLSPESGEPVWVNATDIGLQQIVLNLAINARDAMRGAGSLQFEVDTVERPNEPSHARLVITDTGPGIDPCIKDRIFEGFLTTKPPGEGTGLGLVVVQQIVTAFGGEILAHSTPGQGAAFEIRLPLMARQPAAAGTGTGVTHAGKLVLLAEDRDNVREVIAAHLRSTGFEVEAFNDGAPLLSAWRAKKDKVSLLVLDIDMPTLSGLECRLQVRQADAHTPILLMTGSGDTRHSEFASDPRTQLLNKPFRMTDFGKIVSRVVAAGSPTP